MAMTNAERQRAYRERKTRGELAECKKHQPITSAERQRKYRQKHPELKAIAKIRRFELKKQILTYYGDGKCACVRCGEKRLVCLSIDHINGGGNKHMKSLHKNFYDWLIENDYPTGYQTLCMNCQFVKRFEKSEHN